MPKTANINWDEAKMLYFQGCPFAEIARRLNCNAATIRSHAHREDWHGSKRKALEKAPQVVDWREKAEQWPKRVATLMEKRLDYLESIPVEDLTMKELRELSATTKETNEMAREAYGISDQAPKMYVGLYHNIVEVKLDKPAPMIDVPPANPEPAESEPEQLPPGDEKSAA
jgi:hypothetical protein